MDDRTLKYPTINHRNIFRVFEYCVKHTTEYYLGLEIYRIGSCHMTLTIYCDWLKLRLHIFAEFLTRIRYFHLADFDNDVAVNAALSFLSSLLRSSRIDYWFNIQ